MVVGNKVVDHEQVSGLTEQLYQVMVVYEVVHGQIKTAWFCTAD